MGTRKVESGRDRVLETGKVIFLSPHHLTPNQHWASAPLGNFQLPFLSHLLSELCIPGQPPTSGAHSSLGLD